MSEALSTKRLKQVAVEFNVSISTVVEFLNSKGIEIENKPTSKVSEDAYIALLQKFQPDKIVKEKSDKLKLTPLIHKEEKSTENAAKAAMPEPKPAVAPTPVQPAAKEPAAAASQPAKATPAESAPVIEKPAPQPEPVAQKAPEKPAAGIVETPAPEAVAPQPAATPAAPEKPAVQEPVAESKPAAPEPKAVPAEPEEPQQFKVVGKIDLDSFNKKKKPAPQPAQPKAEERKPAPAAQEDTTAAPVATEKPAPVERVQEAAPVAAAADTEQVVDAPFDPLIVEKTAALLQQDDAPEAPAAAAPADVKEGNEERKGLTIVGKIDLDQFKPKKKPLASTDDLSTMKKKRRKRKRIGENDPLPNNNNNNQQNNRPQGGGNHPGGGNQQRPGGPGHHGGQQGGQNNFTRVTRDRVQNTFDRNNRPPVPSNPQEKKEMDEKRIQDEIKKTLSRLTKKTGGGEMKSKLKKRKREEKRQRLIEQEAENDNSTIQVTEFITANELATLMNVSVTQVIMACMSLGLMVSINQRLDAETILVVADEFGYEVQFKDAEMDEPSLEEPDDMNRVISRPPIVTIMGHVDHGKTSLLDYIRRSNIIAGEAGGITQHIGAYEVTLDNGKKITFLDTPGHEAFTAMRARGAKGSDIAIIVIAADDSVMPQTREAISHAQAAGVPIVFAFNKIDKEGANTERIREQLAEMNILVEEWGGKYQTQEISAKKGMNVDLLLEKVLLEAEILDLKADPGKRAIGTIIEASLDKGKGIMATVLVDKGTLYVGDPILAGSHFGKIRALFNERGGKVDSAGPATPVQVLGFDGAPTAGERFYVTESEALGKEVATKRRQLVREQGIRTRRHITLDEIGRRLAIGNFKELKVIIKGDVDGSVEALSDSLQKLSTEEIQVSVIYKSVGQITESDVLLASASDAIIIGFQVRPSMSARKLAEQEQIDIRMYSVIYDAIEEVKSAMEGMLTPTHEEKIVCNVEVRDVFKITKVGAVAGCYVLDGKINRNTRIRLVRDGVVVMSGELDSLKRFKDDVKEVATGYECGLTLKNFNDIKEGDIIEGYEEIQVARKL